MRSPAFSSEPRKPAPWRPGAFTTWFHTDKTVKLFSSLVVSPPTCRPLSLFISLTVFSPCPALPISHSAHMPFSLSHCLSPTCRLLSLSHPTCMPLSLLFSFSPSLPLPACLSLSLTLSLLSLFPSIALPTCHSLSSLSL